MNLSTLTVASFLTQALLFSGIIGTNRVFCAVTPPLEEQQEDALQGGDYKDKSSNLRGKGSRWDIDNIASSSGDNTKQFLVKSKDHDFFEAADRQLQSDPHKIMSLPDNDAEVMTFESEEKKLYWDPSCEYSKKFMLINPQTGKALDVDNGKCDDGTNIHLWNVNRSDAQIFHYHYASKAIVNVKCNKAIDISRFHCNNGANIWLWERHGLDNQKFSYYSDMTIRSVGCKNKAIDIYKAASNNGANIISWSKHGNANQKWQIKYI